MIQKDMVEKAKPRLGKSGTTMEVRSGGGAGAGREGGPLPGESAGDEAGRVRP